MRTAVFTAMFLLASTVCYANERLPGTDPLTLPADLVAAHGEQVQGYFLRQIEKARVARDQSWRPDFSATDAYENSLAGHRANCRRVLGLGEHDPAIGEAEIVCIAECKECSIDRITIPHEGGLCSRGVLVMPRAPGPHPVVIVCPDAHTWPEQILRLTESAKPPTWLSRFIRSGMAVFVIQSVERLQDHPYCTKTNGKDRRMILYRLGYIVGRNMPGLDVRDAIAAIDCLTKRDDVDPNGISILGIGQGGMTALHTAAIDRRVMSTVVADYFQARERCWEEPVDRRLCGQLLEFGDAELTWLIAPRQLRIVSRAPTLPGQNSVVTEAQRAARSFDKLGVSNRLVLIEGVPETELVDHCASLVAGTAVAHADVDWVADGVSKEDARAIRDRHFEERLQFLRDRIDASEAELERRWELMLAPASEFARVKAAMLDDFRHLVGKVRTEDTPLHPRSELVLTTEKYRAYRILLNVTEGVEVYGNLLVPRDIKAPAPAVICQHGHNGLPEMITGLNQKEDTPYHEFGRRLAEQGYVVFAPLILHHDGWINPHTRQADALGMMRVSMVVAKTRRSVDFLEFLPFVDPKRIGYYGLSYGGYSAIWVAPLVDRLAAVVISGHFNDWRTKLASDDNGTSYLLHPYEDFYNWNVLHRVTHPELVMMTAPRPVCIEFGLRDGITTPEWTARAWNRLATLRDRYGLSDRILMAQFDGPHEVHGVESFQFLERFLRTPPIAPDTSKPNQDR